MSKMRKYAKQMRKCPTKAEFELRKQLQRWRIPFRSQRPIDFYIVDFLIFKKHAIIEVDGAYHFTDEQRQKDAKRQAYLESKGFRVIRITNDEVLSRNFNNLYDELVAIPDKPYEAHEWKAVFGQPHH